MESKPRSVLIAQMTDLHIGFEPDADENELNYKRCVATLSKVLNQPTLPDLLLLTGDLTENGDSESNKRVKALFGQCPFPVFPLVGNHDDRDELRRAFPDCPDEDGFIQYAIEVHGLRILCLDTLEPGRHGGAFCEARARWLANQLTQNPDTPTVVFMHHPPVSAGIGWMDPRPDAAWIARFGGAIEGHSQIAGIHCGHLHRSVHTSFRGFPLSIARSVAPSVALDLRPISPKQPDDRALVTAEPPSYALHRWSNAALVTHYQAVGDWETLASYGPQLQPMMFEMFAERE